MERLRRLKMKPEMREMLQETVLRRESLIAPLFVIHGTGIKNPVASMPGVFQLSIDNLIREARELQDAGIKAVLLFGIPRIKDDRGSEATSPDGIIQQAVRALKDALPQMVAITDVCLCEYTSHGHCGIVEKGIILNDPTRERLAEMALSHARAGADMVAPSDMMDGTVAAIRKPLTVPALKIFPSCPMLRNFPRRSMPPSGRQHNLRPGSETGISSAERCQWPRGPALTFALRCRGCRYPHGEAGASLSGYFMQSTRAIQPAAGGVPGERGICHDTGSSSSGIH